MRISITDINTLDKYSNSIFLTKEWLSIYDDSLRCYKITDKGNNVIGGFVLYFDKVAFNRIAIKNPPFFPNIGLFYNSKASNQAKKNSEYKKLMKIFAEFLNSIKYDIITISLPFNIIDTQNLTWNKYKITPNYTYRLNIGATIKDIENNFATERRKNIRKAIKDNVTCYLSDDYKIVKQLILNTFDRKHKNIDNILLNKILFEFANNSNSFAFVSYLNDTPISSTFCIYKNDTVYYLLGGYDNKNKHEGGGALAMLNSIKYSKELGVEIFDFEGSMIKEVERYFRGFGGVLTPYYTVNKASCFMEIYMKCKGMSIF